ncbi:MerR family transcriptional regulator [Virgibacillus sp. FSP13]
MKIGAFIKAVETTKDTVRHYEELGMIQPRWDHNRRIYVEKDIQDFHAIKEMQELGMSLKEIQFMFEIKRKKGCGSPELLAGITEKMQARQRQLLEEEQAIKHRKEQVKEMLAVLSHLNA